MYRTIRTALTYFFKGKTMDIALDSLNKRIILVMLTLWMSVVAQVTRSTLTDVAPKPGRIIFITGSCSSGKSSMAKIIAKKLDAKSYEFDEYVMPLILKKFVVKHYGNFWGFFINGIFARNFFSTINLLSEKSKYRYQMKFFKDLREGLAIEPVTQMYREAKSVALRGQDVIVESPIYLWHGVDFISCLDEFKGMNVTYVLAYCPWDDLIARLTMRNSEKGTKTRRELDWVLVNYIQCVDVDTKQRDQYCLESINGKNVHSLVEQYSQPFGKKKKPRIFNETKQSVLNAFATDDDYYVYPRFTYNLVVNTRRNNPAQGAETVLGYLTAQR